MKNVKCHRSLSSQNLSTDGQLILKKKWAVHLLSITWISELAILPHCPPYTRHMKIQHNKSLMQEHKWVITLLLIITLIFLIWHYFQTAKRDMKFKDWFKGRIWSIYCITKVTTLEKAMAPHSSTLAWRVPWMEEPGGLQSMGSLRGGHDWAISLSLFTFMHWRRK